MDKTPFLSQSIFKGHIILTGVQWDGDWQVQGIGLISSLTELTLKQSSKAGMTNTVVLG